ncbi:hypothetical protein BD311DRAFT_674398, partial [Dichomitus squalens]
SALSPSLPGPEHTSIAQIEQGVRLQRLEQEYLDVRRQLIELRMQFEAFKIDKTQPTEPPNGGDARATLKRLVLKSVIPTESLQQDEPLGYDCVREEKDFPHLKFFTTHEWNQWKQQNKKSTRMGEEKVRGKMKSSQGLNHTAPYVEFPDGTPAGGDYINDARKFCRTFINLARNSQYPLPRKWGEADIWLQELFYTALRKKYTLFQLCHNNAKGAAFMYYIYYEAVIRKWDKAGSNTIDLNNALHTIRNGSDLEESELESVRAPPIKRPYGDSDMNTGPRKHARTAPAPAPADQTANGPSKSFKGKQRANVSLLSVVIVSRSLVRALANLPGWNALHLDRRALPLISALPLSVPPPAQSLTPAMSPCLSDPSSSLINASSCQSMQASPAALPTSDVDPTQGDCPTSAAVTSPNVSGPSSLPGLPNLDQSTLTCLPLPINSDALADTPNATTSASIQGITTAGLPPSTLVPSVPTQATVAKKPRAPRKATQWPPAADLKGAKWAYARKWYAECSGPQTDFEDHYKQLSTSERRVCFTPLVAFKYSLGSPIETRTGSRVVDHCTFSARMSRHTNDYPSYHTIKSNIGSVDLATVSVASMQHRDDLHCVRPCPNRDACGSQLCPIASNRIQSHSIWSHCKWFS